MAGTGTRCRRRPRQGPRGPLFESEVAGLLPARQAPGTVAHARLRRGVAVAGDQRRQTDDEAPGVA
eukprot:3368194-Lingulodinium_polyedra.AAC.1